VYQVLYDLTDSWYHRYYKLNGQEYRNTKLELIINKCDGNILLNIDKIVFVIKDILSHDDETNSNSDQSNTDNNIDDNNVIVDKVSDHNYSDFINSMFDDNDDDDNNNGFKDNKTHNECESIICDVD